MGGLDVGDAGEGAQGVGGIHWVRGRGRAAGGRGVGAGRRCVGADSAARTRASVCMTGVHASSVHASMSVHECMSAHLASDPEVLWVLRRAHRQPHVFKAV